MKKKFEIPNLKDVRIMIAGKNPSQSHLWSEIRNKMKNDTKTSEDRGRPYWLRKTTFFYKIDLGS